MITNKNIYEKEPKSLTKVRFQHCDPYGHLNNSKYLDYLINAREDHLLDYYNFNMYSFYKEHNSTWFISKNEIAYLSPAIAFENVIIKTQLLEYSDKKLKIEMAMLDANGKRLKALLWMNMVFFNVKTSRPQNHTEELIELFQSVVLPIDALTIEERTRKYSSK